MKNSHDDGGFDRHRFFQDPYAVLLEQVWGKTKIDEAEFAGQTDVYFVRTDGEDQTYFMDAPNEHGRIVAVEFEPQLDREQAETTFYKAVAVEAELRDELPAEHHTSDWVNGDSTIKFMTGKVEAPVDEAVAVASTYHLVMAAHGIASRFAKFIAED
jgi:hypothetical protein